MKNKDKQKGITLIALIVTIIILIILAGISISALTGNGLFERATQSKDETLMKQAEEEIKLVLSEWQIERATKNISLVDFLDKKIKTKEIDEKEEIDENIEIQKNGYVLIVDTEGNILEAIQKSGPRPQISNVKITLEDGTTEVEENSQTAGTKLKINFDSNIKNGEIKTITPELPYITDGTEKDIEFKIVGTVEGNDYAKTVKISVSEKYIKSVESLTEGVSEISKSGYKKIQVSTDSETVVYNTDVIVYKGDLVLDGTTDVDGAILTNNVYEFGNKGTDVATSSTNAQNMVVLKVEGNLTINEGVILTSCKSDNGYGGPKGMVVYCTETLTNNGTISMTARGAKAEGQNVYLWKNADESYEYVPAIGATGGTAVYATQTYGTCNKVGNSGCNGNNRKTGGGGSGGAHAIDSVNFRSNATSGSGSSGTSYSGGSGGGSAVVASLGSTAKAKDAYENGGAGGKRKYKFRRWKLCWRWSWKSRWIRMLQWNRF